MEFEGRNCGDDHWRPKEIQHSSGAGTQSNPPPGNTAVKRQDTVKREGSSLFQGIKQAVFDVTMEDVSVLESIKLEGNNDVPSTSLAKMKPTRHTFSHLPSAKDEALHSFTQVKQCIYQFDDLGESQQEDVMACECKPLKSGITPSRSHFF